MSTIALAQQLTSALQKHAVFALLADETLRQVVQELEMMSFSLGETIVHEGEPGDCVYFVYSGKVRVFKKGPAGKPLTLATLCAGDLFGEHALLRDEARTASVRAAEDSVLFRLPRTAFARLLRDQPSLTPYLERLVRQRALHRFVQMATVLGAVPARQVLALLDQLQDWTFQSGQIVCREGELGDRMFIIQTGEAKVVQGRQGQETVLAYLGQGDYFGERALVLHEPRYATVVALTDLACLSLSRANFEHLIQSAPQLQEQLRRLEQYPAAEELARKYGVRAPRRRADEAAPPELGWEKLDGRPALPQRPAPGPRRRTWFGFPEPFPFVPQEEETDCGVAALAMITCYYHVPLSVERLRDLAHLGSEGASMLSLTKAAETIGFQWRAVSTDVEHLASLSLPAIAHWKGYHYLVLYALEGDQLVLGDPAVGLVKLSRHDFAAGWTGGLLLLTPTPDLLRHVPARTGWQCLQTALAPFRSALLGVVLVSALLAGIQVAFPALTQILVDRVLGQGGSELPLVLSGGLLLAGGCLTAALLVRQLLIEHVLDRLSGALTANWFDRLLRLPWRYFQSRTIGGLLGGLERSREVQRELARLSLTALLDLLFLLVGLGMIGSYHATLGLLTLVSLALSAGLPFLVAAWGKPDRAALHREAAARSAWVEAIQAMVALKDATAEADTGQRHRALFSEGESGGPFPTCRKTASWKLAATLMPTTYLVGGVCVVGYGATPRPGRAGDRRPARGPAKPGGPDGPAGAGARGRLARGGAVALLRA